MSTAVSGPRPPPARDTPAGRAARGPRLEGLAPVVGRDARIVVLGSFPGVASLAAAQYYAHPRNQFWSILADLWDVDLRSMPYRDRLVVLRSHRVGLWDVYSSCLRAGSLDSAIEAAQFNDLASLRRRAPRLAAVAHNGAESARARPLVAALGLAVRRLPSTSPANASWSFERKRDAWRAVLREFGAA